MKNQTQNTNTKSETPTTVIDKTDEVTSEDDTLLTDSQADTMADSLLAQGTPASTVKSAVRSYQRSNVLARIKSRHNA